MISYQRLVRTFPSVMVNNTCTSQNLFHTDGELKAYNVNYSEHDLLLKKTRKVDVGKRQAFMRSPCNTHLLKLIIQRLSFVSQDNHPTIGATYADPLSTQPYDKPLAPCCVQRGQAGAR